MSNNLEFSLSWKSLTTPISHLTALYPDKQAGWAADATCHAPASGAMLPLPTLAPQNALVFAESLVRQFLE